MASSIRISLAKGDPYELILGASALPGAAEQGRADQPNLIHFHELNRGNHLAAWNEPDVWTTEIRAAFRSLR